MLNSNGNITYEVCIGAAKRVVKTVRGKITPKRVECATRTWDHSGRRVSVYRSGMRFLRLLSFQADGGDLVTVAEPTPVEVPTARELLGL